MGQSPARGGPYGRDEDREERDPLRARGSGEARLRLPAVLAICAVAALALPATASAVTRTFVFTGAPQTFTVPAGVNQITVDASGAQGGQSEDGVAGGLGARATATVQVTPGQELQVNVGGQPPAGNPAPGGFNGGGPGGLAIGDPTLVGGGGGGGASDLRKPPYALADRLVIAGGGGGGGGSFGSC